MGGTGYQGRVLEGGAEILATFTPDQIKRLIAFKPKRTNQTRTHAAALLILDGGYRISEGNKHRLVPLSVEMQKSLYPTPPSIQALEDCSSEPGTIPR